MGVVTSASCRRRSNPDALSATLRARTAVVRTPSADRSRAARPRQSLNCSTLANSQHVPLLSRQLDCDPAFSPPLCCPSQIAARRPRRCSESTEPSPSSVAANGKGAPPQAGVSLAEFFSTEWIRIAPRTAHACAVVPPPSSVGLGCPPGRERPLGRIRCSSSTALLSKAAA